MLLESLDAQEPGSLEVQAFVELARGALLRVYRAQRRQRRAGVPRVRISPAQVMKYNLPATAGFLLSLIDGRIVRRRADRRLGHGPLRRAARPRQPARRGHRRRARA